MLDIKKRITCIQNLLDQDNIESLTYAALEARLTIEHICYERIINSQPYYSRSDLKVWTPKQVVRQISREANELIDQGLTLYISRHPRTSDKIPTTQADFDGTDWIKVGDQIAIRLSKFDRLHNALSKHALHLDVPKDNQAIETYGDAIEIRKKVEEALAEFKPLEAGTMLAGSITGEYSFDCETCNARIRRKADLLKNDQIVSCFNENCVESYRIHVENDDITYSRRTSDVHCRGCQRSMEIPSKKVETLRFGETFSVECTCGASTTVGLIPQSWLTTKTALE